jgi:hypothetical protein
MRDFAIISMSCSVPASHRNATASILLPLPPATPASGGPLRPFSRGLS